MPNCAQCYLNTGEYPDHSCGECGRWAADQEMRKWEIDQIIHVAKAYDTDVETARLIINASRKECGREPIS